MQELASPVLGRRELYELSGHWTHFRGDMFPPMELGGEQLVLRPSLCPHHAARRVPYQAVIGPKEQAEGAVALRLRGGRRLDPLPAVDIAAQIAAAPYPVP